MKTIEMLTPVKVWTRFTKVLNGKEVKFRIQELPKEKLSEVLNLVIDYFVMEEPVQKATRLTENEKAFTEYKFAINMLFGEVNYQIDACCIDDDSEDLKVVAGSIMTLERKGELDFNEEEFAKHAQTTEMKTFLTISSYMAAACKISEKYNLDLYYDDRGIVVHPDYRGIGIAGELFKAREVACRERGVPMTGAWMTSIGSQKAAAKLGWEVEYELNYKELEEKFGVSFEGAPKSCKLMVYKV